MSISDFFKKIFSRLLIGNCLGVILITFLLCIGALVFLNVYTLHNEDITVPNVCGMDEQVAKNKLKAVGLNMEVADTGYVFRAAPYSVLEQSIAPGKKVKEGRIIHITINANGPRRIAIPDVADNSSRREAEDRLRILGFKLGATEYITGDPEWVYEVKVNGRTVNAGTKVSLNSPITLVVGRGGMEEEYNGNDSLDYILNTPDEDELLEGETSDAPDTETSNSTSTNNSGEPYFN